MTTPAKYPRTLLWPGSPCRDDDDRNITNAEDYIGKPIVITEKLDGLNTLLYRGQALPRTGGLQSSPWLAMARKHHAWKLADPGWRHTLIYAEDLHAVHSVRYDPLPEDRMLRVFASVSDDKLTFDSWERTQALTELLDIPTVPVLFSGTVHSLQTLQGLLDQIHAEPSALGPEREGAVIRNAYSFPAADFHLHTCKSVRRNHVTSETHWRRNWQPAPTISDIPGLNTPGTIGQ